MKKRILYYLFILLLFPHNGTGQTVARMSDRPVNTSQWITTHFARGVVPPFSFESYCRICQSETGSRRG